jgi:glycosyltransferase involved in cell wall biosynthesis
MGDRLPAERVKVQPENLSLESVSVVISSPRVKRILFVSNLFPRPDAPRNGIFNAAIVSALHSRLSVDGGRVDVLVPVAEWRIWNFRTIRRWAMPVDAACIGGSLPSVVYVPCFYIPRIGRALSFLTYTMALSAFGDAAAACDAVIGSWLYPDAVAAANLATRQRKPCWIRLHGSDRFHLDASLRGRACRRALAEAAGILVNAEFMKRELIQRGLPEARISVVRNGIDRELFHPDAGPATGPEAREPHILWAGNMVEIKRPDLAIRAFSAMLERYAPDWRKGIGTPRLTMAGDGPLRPALARLCERLEVAGLVEFTGSLDRHALAARMRKASALLLTSRSEGMPNVVTEALASGIPVVSTAVGDVPSVVKDGINGVIVDCTGTGDAATLLAHGLHQAMTSAWNADTIRESVGAHDWNCSAQAILQIMGCTG